MERGGSRASRTALTETLDSQDGKALPETWDEVKLRASYTFGTSNLSTSYRWWDGDNDAGDLTEWSRTNQSLMATLWMAPAPEWSWFVTGAWTDTELDLAASIPLFDGYRYLEYQDDEPVLVDSDGSVDFYRLGLGWRF